VHDKVRQGKRVKSAVARESDRGSVMGTPSGRSRFEGQGD